MSLAIASTQDRRSGYTSVEGAASYTTLSDKRIRQLITANRLRAHRVDGRILVAYADLDVMVRSGGAPVAAAEEAVLA